MDENQNFDENAYYFPNRGLLELSNEQLHDKIKQNLDNLNHGAFDEDVNCTVKIDYAQDIVQQACDILQNRGVIFSDSEKELMVFIKWKPTTLIPE